MTLHRSALLFYLPFPAFYCSTLSPFHHPNSRFTLSSFCLSNIQEAILTSYAFTFPSFKSSFFTFNPSPFLVQTASSNRTSPPLEGLGEAVSFGVGGRPFLVQRPPFHNLISLNEVPDINLSRSTCPFMPRTLPRSVNCQMLCLPAPFISGRRELYFPRKRKYVLKRGARCEL